MNFAKPFGIFNRPGECAASAIDFNDRAFMANFFHVTITAFVKCGIVRQARGRRLRQNDLFGFHNHLFAQAMIKLDDFNMQRIVVFVDV